jgi:hypothetical protein
MTEDAIINLTHTRKHVMARKKNEKIPYQEYQKLKEKAAKSKFKFSLYPTPVLVSILIPLSIFLLTMLWYFINVKNFTE